jgi:hypothetical protein
MVKYTQRSCINLSFSIGVPYEYKAVLVIIKKALKINASQ